MSEPRQLPPDSITLKEIGFLAKVNVGGVTYHPGASDWLPYGQVDLAIADERAVLLPPPGKRTIRVRITTAWMGPRSGVHTSQGDVWDGDEADLPEGEARALFNTRRATAVGTSPLEKYYALAASRPLSRRSPACR